jgi:hypothetical protein
MTVARRFPLFLLSAILFVSSNANACEPIYPFMDVVGGPGMLLQSWVVLLVAVAMKSILFAASQKQLGFVHALMLMILANALTTLIGVLAGAMLASGPILFVGIFIVWGICIVPAKRLIAAVKLPWLKRFSPGMLAGAMSLILAASCILFGISAGVQFSGSKVVYWLVKLAAIYPALMMSMVLTAFWEEWVVWKLSSCPVDYSGYVRPVIRANLVVLLCVMAFGAAVALPKRTHAPDFMLRRDSAALHDEASSL